MATEAPGRGEHRDQAEQVAERHHWTAATGALNSRCMAGNVIATMLASGWLMNAPKQTRLTASHGARGFSLMAAGIGGPRCFCKRTVDGNVCQQ
jgi:hypothetical protein